MQRTVLIASVASGTAPGSCSAMRSVGRCYRPPYAMRSSPFAGRGGATAISPAAAALLRHRTQAHRHHRHQAAANNNNNQVSLTYPIYCYLALGCALLLVGVCTTAVVIHDSDGSHRYSMNGQAWLVGPALIGASMLIFAKTVIYMRQVQMLVRLRNEDVSVAWMLKFTLACLTSCFCF